MQTKYFIHINGSILSWWKYEDDDVRKRKERRGALDRWRTEDECSGGGKTASPPTSGWLEAHSSAQGGEFLFWGEFWFAVIYLDLSAPNHPMRSLRAWAWGLIIGLCQGLCRTSKLCRVGWRDIYNLHKRRQPVMLVLVGHRFFTRSCCGFFWQTVEKCVNVCRDIIWQNSA